MTEADVPVFPLPRECPLRAPAPYRAIRAEHPVSRARKTSGERVWLVTSYHLATLDAPDHGRHRRTLAGEFTLARASRK